MLRPKLAPPNPPSSGEIAINRKHASLLRKGLNLGLPIGPHTVISNGLTRMYRSGRIYWSESTGAHEVHGGILQKYVEFDEAIPDAATGNSILGFPISDEKRTLQVQDSIPVSYFEKGAIFFVRGAGAVVVNGVFYEGIDRPIAPRFPNDFPIEDVTPVADGHALFFGHYCLFSGACTNNKIIELFLSWPQLGKPHITEVKSSFSIQVAVRTGLGEWAGIDQREPQLIAKILGSRFVFQDVRNRERIFTIGAASQKKRIIPPLFRNLPNHFIQEVGYIDNDASRPIVGETGVEPTTNINGHLTRVVDLTGVTAKDPRVSGKVVFKRISPNPLNKAPGLLDPGFPLDPPLPQPPQTPQELLRLAIDLKVHGAVLPKERRLYDVGMRIGDGRIFRVAPHAYYIKEKWANFGFAHITDIHVSRRLDTFAKMLRDKGKNEGAEKLNNWNDAFRDFIKYANHLHSEGLLDIIIATGDLVDYEYEWAPNQFEPDLAVTTSISGSVFITNKRDLYSYNPGSGSTSNWTFFRQLILGQIPYADSTSKNHEELKVPIFTTLGNHDYRRKPYPLLAEAFKVKKIFDVEQYSGLNLTEDEAKELVGGITPKISADEAGKSLYAPDILHAEIGPSNQLIKLGPHRIALLDTGRDAGLFKGDADALLAAKGFNTEDKNNLAAGAPNSEGISQYELQIVERAINEAGTQGLVIIGLHAPPINPKGTEYPHYFRETEHAGANAKDVFSYLERQANTPSDKVKDEWQIFSQNGDLKLRNTDYFKKGGIDLLLDWGIASHDKGETLEFLKTCVGKTPKVQRAADLVFFGHVHRNVEFRLGWDEATKELLYFMDFYSENPVTYYKCHKFNENDTIHMNIRNVTKASNIVTVRDNQPSAFWKEWKSIDIPKNNETLNDSNDPKKWWDDHRPILCQTAALGPATNTRENKDSNKSKPGPVFQGFRFCQVKKNKIEKMRYITMPDLRANNFILPWEKPRIFRKPNAPDHLGGQGTNAPIIGQ